MAANLPWDITIEILSRLPVKSLMRFKCVSKSFCSLISQDSHFKRKHLHQSATTPMAIVNLDHAPDRLFSCSLSSLSSYDHHHMIELDNPIKGAKYSNCKVHNSCDGLVCIEDKAGRVCIWNPSTRELKTLPDCVGARWILYDRIAYGLGYDSSSDDYKLLSIYRYRLSRNLGTEFQLCSLKRGSSWRRIRDFPCGKFGVWDSFQFFNGAFYWIEYIIGKGLNRPLVIVSFEIKTEKFNEFEVAPRPPIKYTMFDVSVLGGKLCLYSSCSKVSFDLWVIQEYGIMESLTKMLSIRIDEKPHISKSMYYFFKPLYLFEDGKIMLRIKANNRREQVNIYKDGDSAPKTAADNCNIRTAYIYNETFISPHINISKRLNPDLEDLYLPYPRS